MSKVIVLEGDAAREPTKGSTIKNLAEGVSSLDAQVASLPFCVLRESNILAIERSLVAMQSLLYDLRQFIAVDADA